MIVRLFNSGTSNGNAPVNYLMGMKDHNGEIRSVAPELLEGDPQLTIDLINSIERQHKYTSGVISFRKEELPTEKQMKQIIKDFRKSFLPGLDKDNFSDLWVIHRDKKNVEMHFLVLMEDLKSGKQLNISPPGKRTQEHFNTFTKVQNHKNDWFQVIPDPLRAALSGFEAKTYSGEKSKAFKNKFAEKVSNLILNGKIENREQLIDFLKEQKFEVTRVGKDYISIKMPSELKARRLKGPMFEEGANYADLVKQHHAAKIPTKLTDSEFNQANATLNEFISSRLAFNTKAYLTPKTSFRRPRTGITAIRKVERVKKYLEKNGLTNSNVFINPVKTKTVKSNTDKAKPAQPLKFKTPTKKRGNSIRSNNSAQPSGNSVIGIMIQIGSLETELFQLGGQMSSETDHIKIAEMKAKYIAIQLKLKELYKQIEDSKKSKSDVKM